MKNIAVFLDRDGVIKYAPDIYKIEQLKLLDFSSEVIKIFNKLKVFVIIVAKQLQVAKSYYTNLW
jgi:histidinol phosphatase-like enzyme